MKLLQYWSNKTIFVLNFVCIELVHTTICVYTTQVLALHMLLLLLKGEVPGMGTGFGVGVGAREETGAGAGAGAGAAELVDAGVGLHELSMARARARGRGCEAGTALYVSTLLRFRFGRRQVISCIQYLSSSEQTQPLLTIAFLK